MRTSLLIGLVVLGCLPSQQGAAAVASRTQAPTVAKMKAGYRAPGLQMTIPAGLGRAPNQHDVVIERGFDGRTPAAALKIVRGKLRTPVARENEALVNRTIEDTHRAFTVAVNNVFVEGSPAHTLVNGPLAGAAITIVGTMSAVRPTAIMAKLPTDKQARFFVPKAGGGYEEMAKLPYSIVMKARLENGSAGGLRVGYTTWSNEALTRSLTTVTEQ